MLPSDASTGRRRFLKLLAASPLLSVAGLSTGLLDDIFRSPGNSFAPVRGVQDPDEDTGVAVSSVEDVLNIFDLQKVAEKNLRPEHYAYLATGVDDDSTLRANREGYLRYQLRMRPLADISKVDMSVQLFGTKWNTPIVLCPTASQRFAGDEGEVGVAKAARSKGVLFTLASGPSFSVEDVNNARGEPVWFQLYARGQWPDTLALVKRVETAGCPTLVWTVDLLAGSNRERNRRSQGRLGTKAPECIGCHEKLVSPMSVTATPGPAVTYVWSDIKRLKDATKMKLLVKGIQTREDAEQAIAMGVDGIWVSNHGGRAGASLRSTIETMPEIAAGVAGRVPIIMDSGIRRGTDIFKALALGATAVGIGRAYLFGLGAFGQAGVEAAIEILRRELLMVMRQTGTTSLAKITRSCLVDRLAPISGPGR